jgi:DNA-binding IscR family transcriptional regulator
VAKDPAAERSDEIEIGWVLNAVGSATAAIACFSIRSWQALTSARQLQNCMWNNDDVGRLANAIS